MNQRLSLNINGENHDVDVDPEMLYVLRNDVGLNNPHFGSGLVQCGACTVRQASLMLSPRKPSKGGHSVVSFRPWSRGFISQRSSNVTVLLSLAKYERDGQEDDYRQRMLVNMLAFVVTIALIVTGVWLASSLR
jgi:hypothetical protein